MLNRKIEQCLLAMAAWCAAGLSVAAAADVPSNVWRTPKLHSRILRYDAEKDEFVHLKSIITTTHEDAVGIEGRYYANRLDQYRYLGRTGRGGIYDAIREYHESIPLDPRNYRYHRRF